MQLIDSAVSFARTAGRKAYNGAHAVYCAARDNVKTLMALGTGGAIVAGRTAAAQQFDGFIAQDESSGGVSMDPTVITDFLTENLVLCVSAAVGVVAIIIVAALGIKALKRFTS